MPTSKLDRHPQPRTEKCKEFRDGGGQRQLPYPDQRPRLYLTKTEVELLIKAAKSVGRHQLRDGALILIAYRHGLRVSEICDLRWSDVDFEGGLLWVRRLKHGICTHHPLEGDELRLLRGLQRLYSNSPFIFESETRAALTRQAIFLIVVRAGRVASLPFPTHPHQLRHGCGYYLANKGVSPLAIKSYLGHRDLRQTLHYCELAPGQFEGFWR